MYGVGANNHRALWWRESKPGAEMAQGILAHVNHLRHGDAGDSDTRRRRLAYYRALMLDRNHPDHGGGGQGLRQPYPVLCGAADSVHAKITSSRPRPQILAVGGRWKHGRKAKLLQRWIDGFYDQYDVYQSLANLVQDAQYYDAGHLKVYGSGGRVIVERVWDGNLYVDPNEEMYGPVRTLYHVQAVDRYALIERFPDKREAIIDAPAASFSDSCPFPDLVVTGSGAYVDHVTVHEAYRLGPGGDTPGKFAVAIGGSAFGTILAAADYERETFPFVSMVWGRDPERWRGRGFVEQGVGIQRDLDNLEHVTRGAYQTFVPRWACKRDSNIKIASLGDHMGNVLEFDGDAPFVLAPPPVSPDFLQRGEALKRRIYQTTGASELEASAMVQPNLSSGRAILAHQDATSIRFLEQGRRFERSGVALAKLILDVADEITTDEKSSLKVYGIEDGAELIDYKDAKMDRDARVIRVYPASKMPDTPAGKLEMVGEMMDREIISDKLEGRRLLDMPDLERAGDLASAKREYAEKEVERCLDGEQGIPTAYMDVPHAIKHANLVLCDALMRGGEEDDPESMGMLRDFIGAAMAVQAESMAPPPGAAPMPDAAAPPMPGPGPGPGPEIPPPDLAANAGPPPLGVA